jgi:hypothetical protein
MKVTMRLGILHRTGIETHAMAYFKKHSDVPLLPIVHETRRGYENHDVDDQYVTDGVFAVADTKIAIKLSGIVWNDIQQEYWLMWTKQFKTRDEFDVLVEKAECDPQWEQMKIIVQE